MSMTNMEIIERTKIELFKEGKIKTTGRFISAIVNGEEQMIPELEPIHTFAKWKELGFNVKKGEHAIAQIIIWKHKTSKKHENDEETNVDNGYCFQKKAFFFSLSQVEQMKKGAEQ